jgi:sugar phosphate isomerase/epimerase
MNRKSLTRRNVLAGGLAAAATGTLASAGEKESKPSADNYRLRLSIAAYSYRKYLYGGPEKATMNMSDFIDLGAEMGLDAVEPTSYYIYDDSTYNLHQLKAKAFRLGLEISGTAMNNNFVLPHGEELNKQLAKLHKWVDAAVELGAPHLRIFAGKKREGKTRDEDFKILVDAMRRAVDYASARGVFLGIENHGYMSETAEDLLRMVEAVDSPWFGINLDSANFHDHPYEQFVQAAPKAINVQIKTHINEGGQRKDADFHRLFDILRKANYKGYVALEYEGSDDPRTAIPKVVEQLKPIAAGHC